VNNFGNSNGSLVQVDKKPDKHVQLNINIFGINLTFDTRYLEEKTVVNIF